MKSALLCEYGCGLEATHTFGNGRSCCSGYTTKCPAVREADSIRKRGINPWEGRVHPRPRIGVAPANKGVVTSPDIREKLRLSGKKYWDSVDSSHRWDALSETDKESARNNMRKNRIGGYIKGSGFGKSGRYGGVWCDSSWELAYLLYHLDHDIPIERNREKFTYTFEGKTHKYTPDFVVGGELIEIKGVVNPRALAKIHQCTREVILITKTEISPYLEYATTKYGKNFIELYTRKDG